MVSIGIVSFDERGDVRSEGSDTAIDTAPDLLIGKEREEAHDLIEPYELVRVRSHASAAVWPAISKSAGSVGSVATQDEMDVKLAWHSGLDLVQNLRNSAARCRPQHLPMTRSVAMSRAANSDVVPCLL
ncbi:hypothetical protein XH97_06800 [Bradyrhizobium sp. CCBAU 53380]|nr:hypothetical protein [Bradyrhizobium sp. CCBAU 53380]